MSHVRLTSALALVTLCWAAMPAAATWGTTPRNLSVAGQNATDPRIAVATDGTATAVWVRSNGTHTIIQAARYSSGAWGPTVDLSLAGANASTPRVVVDTSGVVTVVWRRDGGCCGVVQAKRYTPGSPGSWGTTTDLGDGQEPTVGVDGSGGVTVVWNYSYTIRARRYTPGPPGAWDATETTLSAYNAGYQERAPNVAVNASGLAVAVWNRSPLPSGTTTVKAARYTPGSPGSWGGIEAVATGGESTVAVAPDGAAVAVWVATVASYQIVQTARYAAGVWGAPVNLSETGAHASSPRIAMDPDGTATVVWIRPVSANYVVQTKRSPLGIWDPTATTLSGGGAYGGSPALAAGVSGTATVLWLRPSTGASIVQVKEHTTPSGWTATATDLSGTQALTPHVAVNASGVAMAVWARTMSIDGITNTVIQAALPPTIPEAPATVTATSGNTQLDVAWAAPVWNGGSAVTGYTATATPVAGGSSSTCAGGSSATSCSITGLTNGSAYTVGVTATNGEGAGPSGAAAAPVTPARRSSAPQNVTATPGNGQVDVGWQQPLDNGGSAVTGYTATATPVAGGSPSTCTGGSSATSCSITGLTNGAAYTITVTATNVVNSAAGAGASGAATAPVTPRTTPSAPQGVTGTSGDGQVTISFSAPVSDGGSAITGYTVTASPGGGTCTAVPGATSCTISGLTNGTTYSFTATATNAGGTSAGSSPSVAVTPAAPAAPSSGPGAGSPPATAPIPSLGARTGCRRGACTTTGTVPVPATRITQSARRVMAGTSAAHRLARLGATPARARCTIRTKGKGKSTRKSKKRTYTCTVRLAKGQWTITTGALSRTGAVVAQTVKVTRVK